MNIYLFIYPGLLIHALIVIATLSLVLAHRQPRLPGDRPWRDTLALR